MPVTSSPSSRPLYIAELISRLNLVAYGGSLADGLTPTQWTVLHFFSRANRYSRTVSAFAEYNVTTRGTASQTIKTLVEHGYLTRKRSATDGRSVRFDLTRKAHTALANDPLTFLVNALAELPQNERRGLKDNLERILASVASATGRAVFGPCRECALLGTDSAYNGKGGEHICELMDTRVPRDELDALCASFRPAFKQG